jgi:hypothetical protein
MYSRISQKVPIIWHENLQCESPKPYSPPTCHKQPVHKQINTGTPQLQSQKHDELHAHNSVYLQTCDTSLGLLMLSALEARDPVELILLYHFLLYANITSKKFSLAHVSLLLTASSDLPNSSSINGYITDSRHWSYIQCLEKIN